MKPLFSISVIAKNESKTLPRLVASLNEFKERGGSIVVLDTGSTDGTPEIARNLGCEVYEESFTVTISKEQADGINARLDPTEVPVTKEGDTMFGFSAARNRVSDLSPDNWVWHVDADELFTKLDIDAVNEAISNPAIERIENDFVFNHLPDGTPGVSFLHSKLFDKTKLRWRGIVHELQYPIDKPYEGHGRTYLGKDKIGLEHFQNHETNRGQYLTGLALDTYLDPTNDRNSHYYGRELLWCGRPKSALKEFERHILMNCWPTERSQSMIFMGDCFDALGDKDKAIEWYHKSFELEPNRREALMKLCGAYAFRGEHQKVVCFAAAALQIPANGFYANNMEHYTVKPHEFLYRSLWWLGRREDSKEHYHKCIDYQPLNPHYHHDEQFYDDVPGVPGWFNASDIKAYRKLVEAVEDGSTIIELGSWLGRSLCSLAEIIKRKRLQVRVVDTFKGTDNEGDAHKLAKEISLIDKFKENIEKYGLTDYVVIHQMTTNEAAAITLRQFPLVFIDAAHDYESVKEDIKNWLPKVCKGGVLAGHDITWDSVRQAVEENFGKDYSTNRGNVWFKQL